MNENPFRGTPESRLQVAQALGAKPFEILTNQVSEQRVLDLMRDQQLMTSLLAASWPTDESLCEVIAKKHGLGAEYIAAISKYQRAIMAEREESGSVN